MKTALVAGSTGLVGSQLLELLLKDERYSKAIAISRKKLTLTHSKLVNVICELSQFASHQKDLKADDVFCCLGTTMRQAKSKEAFRAVDFDAPFSLAKISREQGAKRFLLVSALGANKSSSIFYNRVKGEAEESIRQIGFDASHIFRPSLLLGTRKEQRSGEEAAKVVYKFFGWLVPNKYQAIESIKVARAMLAFANEEQFGNFVHESREMQNF
ncbi:MAG: NAD(P)H-binding protein [Bacteroidetes bacterium]|nr:NAD(P)H-binding protein [Bacteroidota bacterium]MBI3482189.1 NAD(P)H-binding protein [Bacteroidota bacterium]